MAEIACESLVGGERRCGKPAARYDVAGTLTSVPTPVAMCRKHVERAKKEGHQVVDEGALPPVPAQTSPAAESRNSLNPSPLFSGLGADAAVPDAEATGRCATAKEEDENEN